MLRRSFLGALVGLPLFSVLGKAPRHGRYTFYYRFVYRKTQDEVGNRRN
jgi:hypothetical protein